MKHLAIRIWKYYKSLSLVKQIPLGILAGVSLALTVPQASFIALLGTIFVDALKATAPLLVFFVVLSSLAKPSHEGGTSIKKVLCLFYASMLLTGLATLLISLYFRPVLTLQGISETPSASCTLRDSLYNLLGNCVQNPVEALTKSNYIGILLWAALLGIVGRRASAESHQMLDDITRIIRKVITTVISFAPIGVMGLIFSAVSTSGLKSLEDDGELIFVLVGTMIFAALVINPALVYLVIKRNPYPLVFKCLKDSGVMGFLTRSSNGNIPINLALCQELNLNPATYSVTVPLGATINKCGTVITIITMTLATLNTMHTEVSFTQALFLCLIATICSSGSAGVVGSSLIMIPTACSIFGIPDEISMQTVGVGFIINVIQDPCETALNSSSDPLLTAACDPIICKKA